MGSPSSTRAASACSHASWSRWSTHVPRARLERVRSPQRRDRASCTGKARCRERPPAPTTLWTRWRAPATGQGDRRREVHDDDARAPGRLEGVRHRDLAAGRHPRPHRVHAAVQPGADRERRAGRRAGPGAAGRGPGGARGADSPASRWSPTGRSPRRRSSWPASGSSTSRAPERAYEIAARVSAAPGKGGVPMNMPIEVRQVMSEPARGPVTEPDSIRPATPMPSSCCATLAPQVLGAVIRRFGDFASAEDAVQEALLAAAMQWPEQGVPEHPRGVADPGRVAADDRPRPPRDRAAAARDRRLRGAPGRPRPGRGSRRRHGARRHADPAVHVRAPGAQRARGDRAHAARRRRPHHRRDRQRVPGAGEHDGAAHQPRQAGDPQVGRAVLAARRGRARGAPHRRPARALSDLQRRLREQRRRDADPRRPGDRGDPPDARRPAPAARRIPRWPACWR